MLGAMEQGLGEAQKAFGSALPDIARQTLDLAKQQSSENPVYYVQYAHARLASVFRQAATQDIPVGEPDPNLFPRLSLPEELNLLKLLAGYPDDPVLLYAAGLTETYLPGKERLIAADKLIARAAERMPESEYPPQTRGYIAEVMETVHGERGGLERAMQLYRRAWLLNRPGENPENRANLDLNIGNIAYLLGSNATAWSYYSRRLASKVPFDNPETELIFQQRYAAVAFQMREKEAPIAGYTRALQLIEGRLDPGRPLELFGRLTRRVVERLFSGKERSPAAEKGLQEQQLISVELEKLGNAVPEAPPSAGWDSYSQTVRRLLEQERILLAGAGSWNREAAAQHGVELQGLLEGVKKSLEDVPRLVETSAELHDRLGLALLEADRFGPAREHFDTAFRLNKGLGRTGNLVANRRSASIATYREAQTAGGEEHLRLLRLGRDGFREELSLIELYPPAPKEAAKRSGGLFSFGATKVLDKGAATQAAFGFSAEQERRLAEAYLARILSELGEPAASAALLRSQLGRYPVENDKVAVRVRLTLSSPFDWPRRPMVVFRRTTQSKLYRVIVNRVVAGAFSGAELEKGIAVTVPVTKER